jgi:hypothetical protein
MAESIRNKFTITAIIILLSMSCRPKQEDFRGIDMAQWRADEQGCDGARMESKDTFAAQKDKVLTLSEWEVVKVLGTPDRHELSKRNQKFYYYYLEPHGDCSTADSTTKPLRVAIRFNAMGLAKEVRIEKNY